MPMNNLQEYFRIRCSEVLAAEKDILVLFNTMAGEVKNKDLKTLLKQNSRSVQEHVKNLSTVLDKFGGPIWMQEEYIEVAPNTIMVMGITEGSGTPFTRATLLDHDAFVVSNPSSQLLDIHDATNADTLAHFELANYTELIVLAKKLGDFDAANMLQQAIDSETNLRSQLDNTIFLLVDNAGGKGKMAA